MIIAVSTRVVLNTTYPESRDALSHDWIDFLDAKSVTPVLVPNTLRDPSGYLKAVGAQGLLLTGGDDLGRLPGETDITPAPGDRDRTEHALLDHAVNHALPVLGVCRGLQVVNVFFGGSLVRDLNSLGHHINATHPLEIVAEILDGATHLGGAVTNSYHGQGVLLSGLASDLRAFALAQGNVVEGLYHPGRDILAVQWHPERRNPAWKLDQVLFRDWLARCE